MSLWYFTAFLGRKLNFRNSLPDATYIYWFIFMQVFITYVSITYPLEYSVKWNSVLHNSDGEGCLVYSSIVNFLLVGKRKFSAYFIALVEIISLK